MRTLELRATFCPEWPRCAELRLAEALVAAHCSDAELRSAPQDGRRTNRTASPGRCYTARIAMTGARDRATSPPPSPPTPPPPPPAALRPTYQAFLAGFGLALALVASLVTFFLSRRPLSPGTTRYDTLRHGYERATTGLRMAATSLRQGCDRLRQAYDRLQQAFDRLRQAITGYDSSVVLVQRTVINNPSYQGSSPGTTAYDSLRQGYDRATTGLRQAYDRLRQAYQGSSRPRGGVSLLPKSDPGAESGRLDLPEAARHALPSSGYEGGQRSGAASEVGLAAGIHAALASGEPAAQPASNVR